MRLLQLQLGRILLHDPKVLILDEPASDLDPRARIEIRDLLLELRSLGKTIFLSSHILTELSDVCTSIGILEKGRLVVAGPIGEIAARLEMVRAAQAVGHAPPPYAGPPAQQGYAGPPQGYAGPPQQAHAGPPQQAHAGPPQQGHAGPPPQQAHAGPPQQGYAGPPHGHPPVPMPVPRRKVKIRVLGDAVGAAYLVRGGPGIVEVEVIAGVVYVGFEGGDGKIAEIVQHLVRNGVGVIGVEPERNELERIFLEVTRGEVQ